jgi:hypothetical protein
MTVHLPLPVAVAIRLQVDLADTALVAHFTG